MSDELKPFTYLLNAFEEATQAEHPLREGYAEKRQAVLAFVSGLLVTARATAPSVSPATTPGDEIDVRDIPSRDEFHAAIEELLAADGAVRATSWKYTPDVRRWDVAKANYENMLASLFDDLASRSSVPATGATGTEARQQYVREREELIENLRGELAASLADRERLGGVRDELQSLLDVRPGKRVPYLQGLHGQAVVKRAIAAIDAAQGSVTSSGRPQDSTGEKNG